MAPLLTSESSSLQRLRIVSARVAYIVSPLVDALLLTAFQRGRELAAQEAERELARVMKRGLRLSAYATGRLPITSVS
jgi:hypothetical protein